MLNRLSYYIDELRSDGKIDYDDYLNLREMSDQLWDENAALRERLEKAVELPYMEKCNEYTKIIYKNNYGDIEDETYFHDCFYGENKNIRGDICRSPTCKDKGTKINYRGENYERFECAYLIS